MGTFVLALDGSAMTAKTPGCSADGFGAGHVGSRADVDVVRADGDQDDRLGVWTWFG